MIITNVTYIDIYIYIYIYLQYAYTHIVICIYIHIIHEYIWYNSYNKTYIHMHISLYIYIYIYKYIYIIIHIVIYTKLQNFICTYSATSWILHPASFPNREIRSTLDRPHLVAGEMLPFDPRQVGGLFLQPPSYVWWFLKPTHMLHV